MNIEERKKKGEFGVKNANFDIKEVKVDKENGIVEGYFSSFNVKDSDDDIILPGAYAKSIADFGPDSMTNRKIAHLAYHDVRRPIGKLLELKEDDFGLYFRSQLALGTTDGDDFLKFYKDGIIREHSIGFNYDWDATKYDENLKAFMISSVKLWEGSAVVFGSNSQTPNLSIVKSQSDFNNELEKLNERTEIFVKALIDGDYSKKYNELFAIELVQIKEQYNLLCKFDGNNKELIRIEQEKLAKESDLRKRLLLY
jgi:HK97 family phage prohead protease